jgi:hypothetical protein
MKISKENLISGAVVVALLLFFAFCAGAKYENERMQKIEMKNGRM